MVLLAYFITVLIDHDEIDLWDTLLVDEIFSIQKGLVDLLSLHPHRLKRILSETQNGGGAGHDRAHAEEGLLASQD